MSFLVKNKGKVVGTALVDGAWVQVDPGKSVESKFKPLHLSQGLVAVPVVNDPSIKKPKAETKTTSKTTVEKE